MVKANVIFLIKLKLEGHTWIKPLWKKENLKKVKIQARMGKSGVLPIGMKGFVALLIYSNRPMANSFHETLYGIMTVCS